MFRSQKNRQKRDAQEPEEEDRLGNSFIIRGTGRWGGCQDVQAKLSAYGVCSFVRWDPAPPHWRFLFDTNLTHQQVLAVLGHLVDRWQVRID